MRKIVVSSFTLLLCMGICHVSSAQGWGAFKDKLKEAAKSKIESTTPVGKITDKVNEVKNAVDSNNPVDKLSDKVNEVKGAVDSKNPGNNILNKASEMTSTGGAQDKAVFSGSIEDYLQEKYQTIKASESNLNLYTLKDGDCDPLKHNEGAKKLDYANAVSRLKSEGKALMTDRRYSEVMSYGKNYLPVYNEVIKPQVNKTIEEAYAAKNGNKNLAVATARRAQLMAEAAALILYDNQDAKQLQEDASKALKDLGGEYFGNLYVSDFHKKNVGKILFSTRPIIPGKEDPSQFVTSVSGTDKVYAIAYFNGKIKDLGELVSYKINIDGNSHQTEQFNPNTSDLEHSYYSVEVIPDPKVAVHQFDAVQFARVLSTLSPRRHTMEFELVFGFGQYSVSGKLNLDWSNANGDAILANSETALKNAKDNKARHMTLPEVFSKPSKSFTDPELTADKIKAAILANGDYAENIKQIKKVIIGDKRFESNGDWIIRKNDLGIPTHKECNRDIYILFEGKDGWCYFSDQIIFRKDYSGAGTYEETRLVGFDSELYTKIACENLGKK